VCLIESPHPYPDFYKQGWTLINPDLGAKASRIHFARLETEPGWDYVLIMDGKGSVVQSLDGSHPSGLWSQPVSGRTVGVQLVSDTSVTGWGFCVDQIVSTETTPCLAESEHPYPNGYDHTWTLTNPDLGAAATKIRFARLDTEAGYDFVILSDSGGNEVQRFDGLHALDMWSEEVSGRVVQVRLVSDESVSMWGFCVDEVATPSPTATVTSTRTPTGTPSPTPLPWLSATVTATPSPTATRTRGSRVLLPLVLRP
jgi:hypothetical protein